MVDVPAFNLFPAFPDLRILVREGDVVLEHVCVVAGEGRNCGKAVPFGIVECRCHGKFAILVHVRRVVEPLATHAGVVRVKSSGLVFPGGAELDGMTPAAEGAFAHLDAVSVAVLWVSKPVIAVAVPHGVAVFQHHGEFLVNEIEAVVAVPPGTAPDELGRIALAGLLVMRAETVGVFAVALPAQGIVVVMRVAVQEDVPTAVRHAVVCEESGTRIVVAVDLLQEDVLARVKEYAGIRVMLHGRVADIKALQVQILCRNHNRGGVHRALGSAVAMFHACGHRKVRCVKNRALARVGKVMDAVVVALAACREDDCRGHPVTLEKDRIVQVVNAAANPDGIARMHHGICLVERGEGLVLCARRAIAAVGRHVIHGTERLGSRQSHRQNRSQSKHELFSHKHLQQLLVIYSNFRKSRCEPQQID